SQYLPRGTDGARASRHPRGRRALLCGVSYRLAAQLSFREDPERGQGCDDVGDGEDLQHRVGVGAAQRRAARGRATCRLGPTSARSANLLMDQLTDAAQTALNRVLSATRADIPECV